MTNDRKKPKRPGRPEDGSEPPNEHAFTGIKRPGSRKTAEEYALEMFQAISRAGGGTGQKLSRQPGHDHRRIGDRPQQAPLAESQVHGRGWQLDRLRKVLRIVFPPEGHVPPDLTHKEVQARIAPEYKKDKWPLPSPDTIARARGRRKA
jgi:hypothetical protein